MDPGVSVVIKKAKQKGMTVAIAEGNDGYFGQGTALPSVEFPDYGLAASPGIVPDITEEAKQLLTKNLLMSSALPHKSLVNRLYSSPRQQGAGVLNLHNAIYAPAVLYGKNHISSINLGSIAKGGKADVNVTVENIIKKLV